MSEETRDSGVLVAVHVSPDNQLDAARVLRDAGGATIERATGRWQQGRWGRLRSAQAAGAAQRIQRETRLI